MHDTIDIQATEIKPLALPAPKNDAPREMFSHYFWLTPEVRVRLNLPTDLTPSEARRLARIMLTLPCDDSLNESKRVLIKQFTEDLAI